MNNMTKLEELRNQTSLIVRKPITENGKDTGKKIRLYVTGFVASFVCDVSGFNRDNPKRQAIEGDTFILNLALMARSGAYHLVSFDPTHPGLKLEYVSPLISDRQIIFDAVGFAELIEAIAYGQFRNANTFLTNPDEFRGSVKGLVDKVEVDKKFKAKMLLFALSGKENEELDLSEISSNLVLRAHTNMQAESVAEKTGRKFSSSLNLAMVNTLLSILPLRDLQREMVEIINRKKRTVVSGFSTRDDGNVTYREDRMLIFEGAIGFYRSERNPGVTFEVTEDKVYVYSSPMTLALDPVTYDLTPLAFGVDPEEGHIALPISVMAKLPNIDPFFRDPCNEEASVEQEFGTGEQVDEEGEEDPEIPKAGELPDPIEPEELPKLNRKKIRKKMPKRHEDD